MPVLLCLLQVSANLLTGFKVFNIVAITIVPKSAGTINFARIILATNFSIISTMTLVRLQFIPVIVLVYICLSI